MCPLVRGTTPFIVSLSTAFCESILMVVMSGAASPSFGVAKWPIPSGKWQKPRIGLKPAQPIEAAFSGKPSANPCLPARLFRGFVPKRYSVAELMQPAGLTHSGSDEHITSNHELLSPAIATNLAVKRGMLAPDEFMHDRDTLSGNMSDYLRRQDVASLGGGRPVTSLSLDALRTSLRAANAASVIPLEPCA